MISFNRAQQKNLTLLALIYGALSLSIFFYPWNILLLIPFLLFVTSALGVIFTQNVFEERFQVLLTLSIQKFIALAALILIYQRDLIDQHPWLFFINVGMILYAAYLEFVIFNHYFIFLNVEISLVSEKKEMIAQARMNNGQSLREMSEQTPLLLIFIRHFGCTFCKETVSEVSRVEKVILDKGYKPVFVHMSDPSFASEFFSTYFQNQVLHVSDPSKRLYRAFGFKRGDLWQLFGPRTFFRGFYSTLIKGHSNGEIEGDALQLGGVALIHKGEVMARYENPDASSTFDLSKIQKHSL